MKKTTVRFAAVGTVLLLGALAIALAQHDSRHRPREAQAAGSKPAAEAPQPILVDAIDPPFHGADRLTARAVDGDDGPAAPLVRANDDPVLGAPPPLGPDSPARPSNNPLRPGSLGLPASGEVEPLGSMNDTSSIALAAGEGEATDLPSELPALPSLTAGLGTEPAPMQTAPTILPTLPGAAGSPNSSSALPGAPPTAASQTSASTAPSAASGPGGLPSAPPGWVNSAAVAPNQGLASQSLSDTQRPAMRASGLPPSTRSGRQPWLQAPSMPSSSANPAAARDLPPVTTAENNALATESSGVASTGASAPGDAPLSPPPGATRSRLSDQTPAAANATALAAAPAQGLPSLPGTERPGTDRLRGPAGSMPVPGGQPLAPAATLGAPQPQTPLPSLAAEPYSPSASGSAVGALPPATDPIGTAPAQPRGQLTSGSARSLLAGTALGSLISNQPGNRHLDGSQNPIMLIQKRMAGECQVGKPATIVITVRNSGNAAAHGVQVIDSVPSGASFAEAMPATTPTPEGVLMWDLGEMGPGDERTINLQIIPERQGELGSVASVRFAAQASVRTLATQPKLELAYTAAPEVLIGSQHTVEVVVKNTGTGVARNVRLEADLPANIRHESGDAGLEASFGDIAPGESKHIRLNSIAAEAGKGACSIRALTDDGLQQEQTVAVQVLAPALQASINGPNKRYLDRQATFEIAIQNTGTAAATGCEFVLRLPAGLNFNTANKHGTYDPDQHAVLWSVPEFPAGHTESVELTVLPVEVGALAMSFQATAELGVKAEAQGQLTVEEQAELAFTIEQDADPIELSASTTYTVEVRNVGRVDRNVQVAAQLPPGSKILKVDAPVKYAIQGDQLLFEPVPQMDSRTGHKFRFEVQHAQAGTQIVRAQLKSQNRPTPVIKEEATDVYNDRN